MAMTPTPTGLLRDAEMENALRSPKTRVARRMPIILLVAVQLSSRIRHLQL
jgi:hypothetical protein